MEPELLQHEAEKDHKHQAHKNRLILEALRLYSWLMHNNIAQKELKETALLDKTDVQLLAMIFQLVEDDGIYKYYQICTAPFSNNRSILSHPAGRKK